MYWFNHALVHVLFSFVWKDSNHMTNIFSIFCLWLLFCPMIPPWGSWSCRRTNSSQSICLSCRPSQMRDRRTRQPVGVREFCSFFILFRIRRTILSFSHLQRSENQSINQSINDIPSLFYNGASAMSPRPGSWTRRGAPVKRGVLQLTKQIWDALQSCVLIWFKFHQRSNVIIHLQQLN